MIINGGYGELENVRKSVQKDEPARKKADAEKTAVNAAPAAAADKADISGASRLFQMRDKAVTKLKQIPDPREDKIKEALSLMQRGGLMTPEVVKESIGKMVDKGLLP